MCRSISKSQGKIGRLDRSLISRREPGKKSSSRILDPRARLSAFHPVARIQALVDRQFGDPAEPLNGQLMGQSMFRELLVAVHFRATVETGTYRGASTALFREESGSSVYTVELNPRFYYYARRRFAADPNVLVQAGDSRPFLNALRDTPDFSDQTVLFYLDAHWWGEELPLGEELEIIFSFMNRFGGHRG